MVSKESVAKLREIEKTISDSDGVNIRSRWEFGSYMLTRIPQGKKQLPNGTLKTLAKEVNVHPSELSARMKFAATCGTEQELSDAVRKFGTWYRITHEALIKKPRESKPPKTATRRVISLLEAFDAVELEADEIPDVKKMLQNVIVQIDRIIASRRRKAA
jgi:hypothetical protein